MMMMWTYGELEEEEETIGNSFYFQASHTSWNRRLLRRLSLFSVLHANLKLSEAVLIKNQLVAFKVSCVSASLLLFLRSAHAHTLSHTHLQSSMPAGLCELYRAGTDAVLVSSGRPGPLRL